MSSEQETVVLLTSEHETAEPSLWNVLVLGVNFLLLFFAFNTIQAFETTVNKDLGFRSLSALYFAFSLSTLLAGYVVRRLGERLALLLASGLYVLFLAANVRVVPALLIAASALNGVGAAVLWTAQGSWLVRNSAEHALGRNNGLFWGVFQLHGVLGYLTAALYLHFNGNTYDLLQPDFIVFTLMCRRVMFIVFLVVGGVACVSFLLLRPAWRADAQPAGRSSLSAVADTVVLFKEPQMLLLMLIMIYNGLSQSFFVGVMPPRMGKKLLGFVMASFGASCAAGGFAWGRLSDLLPRKIIFFSSFLLASIGLALASIANGERPYLFFITMIIFGFGDAALQVQTAAVLGSFHPQNSQAAFGFFKFLQATSTAASFFYSPHVPFQFLILILEGTLVLGIGCVFYLDRFVRSIEPAESELNKKA